MKKYLPKNLMFLREREGLKKNKLSELLGIPPSTWQGYEDGTSNPTQKNLAKLSEYFKIPENDLLYKNLSEISTIEEEEVQYDTAKAYKTEIKSLKERIKLLTDHINTLKSLQESRDNEIRALKDELKNLQTISSSVNNEKL